MTYDPWEDLGRRHPEIHVDWCWDGSARAAWVPCEKVILINRDLTKVQRRCALAHEIAHIDCGDDGVSTCWFSARQESAADQLAADRLVALDDLLRVSRWCGTNGEAAEALDVTLDVLVLRARTMNGADLRRVQNQLAARELVA